MTIPKMPVLMGLLMGLMLPWMVHSAGRDAGLIFVLAHIGGIALIMALGLVLPSVRRRLGTLRRHKHHVPLMVLAAAAGFGMICAYCLMIGGQHWT